MKKILIAAVVLVVAFVGVAWWQGWFKFEKKTEDGQTHFGVAINKEKFQKDRDKLKKAAAERSKGLKDRLAGLRDKAKGLTGADKEKAEKEIDTLSKKHEAFEAKVKDLDGVAEDKFEALKKEIEGHMEGADKE